MKTRESARFVGQTVTQVVSCARCKNVLVKNAGDICPDCKTTEVQKRQENLQDAIHTCTKLADLLDDVGVRHKIDTLQQELVGLVGKSPKHEGMTYKELAEVISKMTPEQQQMSVTVYDLEFEEHYPVKFLQKAQNDSDVLDPEHPMLYL
jgi:hypothetical protein